MGKAKRKMKRHEPAPVGSYRYDKACNRIAEQAIYQVLALAIDIIWNDFGGLQRRSNRLKFFADNFRERLEKIDEKLSENTKTPHVLSINVRRFFNLVK